VKILPKKMASDPERLERFQREAKVLAALDHPAIVGVFSIEEADNVHFLTMQLIEGNTLERLIPQGPQGGFPLERFFEFALPLTDGLASTHERGVIHRDLKPGNIMVTENGRIKVASAVEALTRFSAIASMVADPVRGYSRLSYFAVYRAVTD